MIKCNKKGFTLLELMITVAIMGIIATMAVPAYIKWIPNQRVKNAADDVFSDLQTARMRAISENKVYVVDFDIAHNSYRLVRDTSLLQYNGTMTYGTLIKTVSIGSENKGIMFGYNVSKKTNGDNLLVNENADFKPTFDTTGSPESFVKFRPDGTATASGEVYLIPQEDITKTKYDRNKAVSVNGATGFIKVWSHGGGIGSAWR